MPTATSTRKDPTANLSPGEKVRRLFDVLPDVDTKMQFLIRFFAAGVSASQADEVLEFARERGYSLAREDKSFQSFADLADGDMDGDGNPVDEEAQKAAEAQLAEQDRLAKEKAKRIEDAKMSNVAAAAATAAAEAIKKG